MRACTILLTLTFLAACDSERAPELPDLASQSSEIVRGVTDPLHPSVGVVANSCTGTVIGKRTVLTAAHCATGGYVSFCRTPGFDCRWGLFIRHPWYTEPHPWTGMNKDYDVALVLFETNLVGWLPSRLSTGPVRGGKDVVVSGFGCNSFTTQTGWGTKRWGSAKTKTIQPQHFYYGDSNEAQGCWGDSGGPVFLGNQFSDCQIGVISGLTPNYGSYSTFASRTDTKLYNFIFGFAAEGGDYFVYRCGESHCGDGICHPGEACSADCGNPCGNGSCDAGESSASCAADCFCGDGLCRPDETASCGDCFCGDGLCSTDESCGTDCCGGPNVACSSDSDCCSAPCLDGYCGYAQ